jgi:hypothetical protein
MKDKNNEERLQMLALLKCMQRVKNQEWLDAHTALKRTEREEKTIASLIAKLEAQK